MRQRNRLLALVATGLVGLGILTGDLLTTGGGASGVQATATPSPGTANVWVVTSGGTCSARQSTPLNRVSSPNSAKCTSFQSACALAAAGDTVRVQESTTYGTQALTSSCGGSAGSRITFDAENGATGCDRQMTFLVSVTSYNHTHCPVNTTGSFEFASAHDLNFKNMSADDGLNFTADYSSPVGGDQARITATNIHSLTFWIIGTDITIEDGEVGGLYVCDQPGFQPQDLGHIGFGPTDAVNRVTVDGYLVHDLYDITGGSAECNLGASGPHSDCIQLAQGTFVTIKNTQFWNCATADIQSNDDFGNGYSDLVYIGNYFGNVYTPGNGAEMGTTTGPQADDCSGTNVQAYNTYRTGAGSQVCGDTGTFIFEGNLQMDTTGPTGWTGAGASVTVDYNVTLAAFGAIGTHSKTCTASFVNAANVLDGFKLNGADTCASNAGKPSSSIILPTDIEGGTRNATPEAGADELGAP